MKLKFVVILLLLFTGSQAVFGQYTQGSGKKKKTRGGQEPHHSVIKGDFKLPTGLSSKAFRKIMDGKVDLDFAYNYRLHNDVFFGAGIKYGFWDIDVNAFGSAQVHGNLKIVNPFIAVGKVFQQDRQFFIETEFKAGYNAFKTETFFNDAHTIYKQSGFNFEPKVVFYLAATDMLAFGLSINYNVIGVNFSSVDLGKESYSAIPTGGGATQYFSIGFGFYTFVPNAQDRENAKR